jgi:hypothetical protein
MDSGLKSTSSKVTFEANLQLVGYASNSVSLLIGGA